MRMFNIYTFFLSINDTCPRVLRWFRVVDCDSLILIAKVSRGYTFVSLYCFTKVRWPFKSIYTGSDCDASLLRLAFLHARVQLERMRIGR
jgi:hypothetical protein